MSKIDKVFAGSEEKFVKNFVVYGKKSDTFIYADAAFTTKISKADLKNMFEKGVIVMYDGHEYTPTALKLEASVATLFIWDVLAASAAEARGFKSSEPVK